MPTSRPSCPRCQDNLFVRAEQIISGRRVMEAFYCGRCNLDWSVENNHAPERRQTVERRRQRLDDLLRLPKKPAPALLRVKPGRRTGG
jgi:transposase-like protein